MKFQKRLAEGEQFEKSMYSIFRELSSFKHITDKVIWYGYKPIFIDFKSSRNMEYQAYKEYMDIYEKFKFLSILVINNRVNINSEHGEIMVEYTHKIRHSEVKNGIGGSYNQFIILYPTRTLKQFLKEEFNYEY